MSSTGDVRQDRRAQVDFTAFYVAYQPRLLRLFRRQAKAMGIEVEDLVQETLTRAYKRRAEFDADENMLAWCYVVAARLLKRWANEGYGRFVDLHAEVESVAITVAPNSEEIVIAREEVAAALAAYTSLSAGHRDVLRDHLFLDMTCPEIAKVRGKKEDAVRAQLCRARGALRKAFTGAAALAVAGLSLARRTVHRVVSGGAWTTVANVGGMLILLAPALPHVGGAHDDAPPVVALPSTVVYDTAIKKPSVQGIGQDAANLSDRRVSELPRDRGRNFDRRRRHHVIATDPPELPVCVQEPCMPGDTIGADLPIVGHRETTENAAPVCDRWVPNPAVTCERNGDPEWVAPSPSPSPP